MSELQLSCEICFISLSALIKRASLLAVSLVVKIKIFQFFPVVLKSSNSFRVEKKETFEIIFVLKICVLTSTFMRDRFL